MKVAVSGGSGFVGHRLSAALTAAGHRVIQPGGPEAVDLREHEWSRDVEPVDCVVHLAARSGGTQFQAGADDTVFSDNMAMLDSMLRYAVLSDAQRFVFTSSAVVYGQTGVVGAIETDSTLGPVDRPSPYAWSKLCGEVAVQWWALIHERESVSLRLGNVYGPGISFDPARRTVVPDLIARMSEATGSGQTLRFQGNPRSIRSFIYVDDVVDAFRLLAEPGAAEGTYNVDSGNPVSILDLAEVIREVLGSDVSLDAGASGLPEDVRVAQSVSLQDQGWQPKYSLVDGISNTIAGLK